MKQSVAVRKILDISRTLNIIFLARFSDISLNINTSWHDFY